MESDNETQKSDQRSTGGGVNSQLQRAYREKHTLLSEIQNLKNELKKQHMVSNSEDTELPLHLLLNESVRAATMTCMWAMRCQIVKKLAIAFHRWIRVVHSPSYEKSPPVRRKVAAPLSPEQKRHMLLSEAFGILHKQEDDISRQQSRSLGGGFRLDHIAPTQPLAYTSALNSSIVNQSTVPSSPNKADITFAAEDVLTFMRMTQEKSQTVNGTNQMYDDRGPQEYNPAAHRASLDSAVHTPAVTHQGKSTNGRNTSGSKKHQFVKPTRKIAVSSSLLQPTQSSRHKKSVSPQRERGRSPRRDDSADYRDASSERNRSVSAGFTGRGHSDRGRSESPRSTRSQALLLAHRESQKRAKSKDDWLGGVRHSTTAAEHDTAPRARSGSGVRAGPSRQSAENQRSRSDSRGHSAVESEPQSRARHAPRRRSGSRDPGRNGGGHQNLAPSPREARTREVLETFRNQINQHGNAKDIATELRKSRERSKEPEESLGYMHSFTKGHPYSSMGYPEDDPSEITLEDALLVDGDDDLGGYSNGKGVRRSHERTAGKGSSSPLSRASNGGPGNRKSMTLGELGEVSGSYQQTSYSQQYSSKSNGLATASGNSRSKQTPTMTKAQRRLLYGDLSTDPVAMRKPWTSQLRR